MHRALEIPEILLIIFKYVSRPPPYLSQIFPDNQHNSDMVALARTCRAFKEPALDILWSALGNLSVIGRCIPDAYYGSLFQQSSMPSMFYRALTQEEWGILRSYTRRIHVIRNLDMGFALDSVPENFFRQDMLFPNLRELNFCVLLGIPPWLHGQHIPSLDSINISSIAAGEPCFIRDCVAPLSEFYPNLTKITVKGSKIDIWSKPRSSASTVYTWPWKDLRVLDCPNFKLETSDLKHLSRLPTLLKLTFAFSNAEDIVAALSSERSVLVFPSLKHLNCSYYCRSLELTSKFLSQIELPAMEQLVVHADGCLAKDIGPFLLAVQAACNNGSINLLKSVRLTDVSILQIDDALNSLSPPSDLQPLQASALQRSLTLDDLRPSMAFSNIRHVELDIGARIHLTDGALLELASAWPFLECLSINEATGWNNPGSVRGWISLDGLHQLLLKCPLLNRIGLAIHMPDEAAAQSAPTTNLNSRSNSGGTFEINVMDSIIGELSVPVIATFLAAVVGPYNDFKLKAWCTLNSALYPRTTEIGNRVRWKQVFSAVERLGRSGGLAN